MKRKILSVGHPEFPLGFAQVQRQLLLAKALLLEGCEVTVLCRYGIHSEEDALPARGNFEGIEYIYCSGVTARPGSFIKRNILKARGLFWEAGYIRKFSKGKGLKGMLVSTNSFQNVLFYYWLGKLFTVTTALDVVEYWTSNRNFKGFDRLDKLFYDRYFYRFADRIICISDFLKNRVSGSKREQLIKIPAITDFEKFRPDQNNPRLIPDRYFLFCGSNAYTEVIIFVISAFERSPFPGIKLLLITISNEEIDNRINQSERKDSILVISDVPYQDLINLYMNSEALIIPMRDTDQDKARFPHKISEYCASARPIITNKTGEINNYFDQTNAYLCDDYKAQAFADAMQSVITDSRQAGQVATKSFQTGLNNFNYKSYSKPLTSLFDKE